MIPRDQDALREAAIHSALDRMLAATTRQSRRRWWALARLHILHRSLAQVARMERERGLAW